MSGEELSELQEQGDEKRGGAVPEKLVRERGRDSFS